jgi:hypothetical protein
VCLSLSWQHLPDPRTLTAPLYLILRCAVKSNNVSHRLVRRTQTDSQTLTPARESTNFSAVLAIRTHLQLLWKLKSCGGMKNSPLEVGVLGLEALLLLLLTSSALHMKDKHAGADDVRAIKRTGQTI